MTMPEGTILVVEDMPQIRGLLEVTLRFEGYPVVSAVNGRDALEKIKESPPVLIITDILMPEMDGYAMVYRLRKDAATRKIPVIFLSATYVTKEDKDFALSLGAVKFLEKPVDTHDFLLTIGEVLAGGHAEGPEAPDEKRFYEGYRLRLENKLRQKHQQVQRTETLLVALPDSQRPAFEKLLQETKHHRDEILADLEDVIQQLKRFD